MKGPQTFDEFYDVLSKRKVAFFMTFFVAVTVTYAILFAIDFIPEPIKETSSEVLNNEANKSFSENEALSGVKIVNEPLPIKIVFDSLDKEITVLNPQSRKIAELDETDASKARNLAEQKLAAAEAIALKTFRFEHCDQHKKHKKHTEQ